jgi:hypothetical protein
MKGFLLSLQSEFYKSRKTLGFWSAILLPLILMFFVAFGFYVKSDKLTTMPPIAIWSQFSGIPMGIMGTLLLPMYIVFLAYSVNSIEHKSDTWKTLFTLPIGKWSIYSAKFLYAVLLILLTLMLFAGFTLAFGNLLGVLKPELKFSGYHMESELFQIYFKFFLASMGILSLQFVMSLLWKDFLKPMGIGFVGTITGTILVTGARWEYAYMFPYSQPLLSVFGIGKKIKGQTGLDFFTNEVLFSLGIALVVYIIGYFIVERKSVK